MLTKLRNKITGINVPIVIKLVFTLRFYLYWIKYKMPRFGKNEYKYLIGKKKCVVLMAADYGNLGDVAITYAQEKFLQNLFPDYEIVDFPISKSFADLHKLKRVCNDADIITLTGGGFMGDLYFRSELMRQFLCFVFKKNRIISFPQTADFSDSNIGKYLLQRATYMYSKCPQLEMWAREEQSYRLMKAHFKHNFVRLTPDIVMSLDVQPLSSERSEITYCLRNDKEKSSNTEEYMKIISQYFNSRKDKITLYDTHIGNVYLNLSDRYEELKKIWMQFQCSKVVVTDRLHGMIFAFITQTPAIVLPNNNFKISECFKWIENCGYIYFVRNVSDLSNVLMGIEKKDVKEAFRLTHHEIMAAFKQIILWGGK